MKRGFDDRTDAERVGAMLQPYADKLEAYPVSPQVNSPKNDDAACAEPLKETGELDWSQGEWVRRAEAATLLGAKKANNDHQ